MRHRLAGLVAFVVLVVTLAACAALTTAGREFPSPKPGTEIKNNVTTKADLLRMYGDPTQSGMKDGDQTWTWYYFKKVKDGELSKQLDVTFNSQGVVKSHSFSSSFPEDMKNR